MENREDRIRDRAYALWQSAGMPEGREKDHWSQAEAEIDAEAPRKRSKSNGRKASTVKGETETVATVSEVPVVKRKRAAPARSGAREGTAK